ncbi:MAG: JAB domain-containing protein [Angelakisella sp.]
MANEHSGHRDRLRERYLSEGLDGFPPHNVLELLLFYSVPRRDTNVLAHRLIEQFGSLVGVLNAAPEQLAQVEGIGMNAAVHLHLVADIARRYYAEAITPPPNDAQREDLMRYYGKKLVAACNGLPEETLYLVCLDNNLREISTDRISTGAPNAVQLPGRKIAEVALRHHAPSILLAHNHPRGLAIPSREDIAATLSLRDALRAISVDLIDHFIIAGSDYVSMAQSGFFSSAARQAFALRSPEDDLDPGFPAD